LRIRWPLRVAIVLGMLAGAFASVTYSWTFTRLGRLDYNAAIIAKIATLTAGDPEFTPEARSSANAYTRGLLPEYPANSQVRVEDRQIPTPDGAEIPIRLYLPEAAGNQEGSPASGPLPFYLDIHGGGWWMGDGFVFESAMIDFAERTNAIVVSVDYRLAPEHPFPTPLDDCHTALVWIAEHGAALGGDPTRIAIGGGSAGGNLSAPLALRVRNEGGPKIAFQYLLVPATDISGTREWHSYDEAGSGYVLTVEGMERMIEAYVPERLERMNPYVSPLLEGDLSGLPPALVVTALFDPLRDQGEAYAHRLEQAGVSVELHREAGALHGFLGSPDRARRVQAMAAETLRAALHP
jgi:acetyl esterase